MTTNERVDSVLLKVEDLKVSFGGRWGQPEVSAVSGVSFEIESGRTVGLIGESGSGKTTLGRAVLGLVNPREGRVLVRGEEVWNESRRQQRATRTKLQVIFQDPNEALDPRMSVAASIREPLRIRDGSRKPVHDEIVDELLRQVGLGPEHRDRKPHEMSGGQKQRVNIARSLVLDPDLIVCDEVVSALDVSIQADVLNIFAELQRERGIAYLFISHDLSVVAQVASTVAVMYLGVLVEFGPVDSVIDAPKHPYTQALIAAQPRAVASDRRVARPPALRGDIPSPADPPSGCRFHTRCPFAVERCAAEVPELTNTDTDHAVACHFSTEIASGVMSASY